MKPDITKFLVAVPAPVEAKLREEASEQRRSRNAQLARILEERYGFVTAQDSNELQPAA